MLIELRAHVFDAWAELAQYEQQQTALAGKHGANVSFIGRMRDVNEDARVTQMELEHYPGMTEAFLNKIAEQAQQQWSLLDVMILHRVGKVLPDDTIVLVAVWSSHRAHAYAANQFIMEALKSEAPLWKKETLVDGQTRWVEKNTPGTV